MPIDARVTEEITLGRLTKTLPQESCECFVDLQDVVLQDMLDDPPFERSQRLGCRTEQPAQQCPRQPKLQRTQQHLLMPVDGKVPLELGDHQPRQHTGPEGTLLHRLRGLLCRDELISLSAMWDRRRCSARARRRTPFAVRSPIVRSRARGSRRGLLAAVAAGSSPRGGDTRLRCRGRN